jgi:hypothetical protein
MRRPLANRNLEIRACYLAGNSMPADLDLSLDYDLDGFSYEYKSKDLQIHWRCVEQHVPLISAIKIESKGELVYLRTLNSESPEIYKPGEWEQQLSQDYERIIKSEIKRDSTIPF